MDDSRRDILRMAGTALLALSGQIRVEAHAMYGLIGQIRAQPGQRDALVAVLLEGVSGMPGCLSYVVAKDPADEDAIWVTEVWDSAGSHEASLTLPAVRAAIARGKPLVAGFGTRVVTEPVGGHGLGPAPGPATAPGAEPRHAALGERVALRVGEFARIGNDGLDVGVDAVVADSRCPAGERCAQEGEAVVRVWLRTPPGPRETRDLHLSASRPGTGSALGHEVRLLQLDPYPVSGRATRHADYVTTLRVERSSDAAQDR